MKYTIRAVKYFLMIVLIFVVITLFMNFSGELSLEERVALFMADNGALKLAFLVVLAAVYPAFGFIKRDVAGDIVENRGQIIVAMESSGFTLKDERDGVMTFRANTIFRRVAFLFEDSIEVSQSGDMIHIEGIRRGAVYAVYLLESFIANSKRGAEEK